MKILNGDSLEILKTLESESVDCIVTSPPYYGLRDYGTGKWEGGDPNCPHRRTTKYSPRTITGHAQVELQSNVGDAIYKTICPKCGAIRVDNQIGLEETPEMFVEKLTAVFHECKRVLKDSGTLWLNIGDTYNGNKKENTECIKNPNAMTDTFTKRQWKGAKQKDLIGVPWLLAFALRADGWYLRQDIIWAKPNPMPESVTDRCTKSHEYIFLLTKNSKYYFNHDAMQEKANPEHDARYKYAFMTGKQQNVPHPKGGRQTAGIKNPHYKNLEYNGQDNHTMHERRADGLPDMQYRTRNKRDVWTVATQANSEAHFATFPEKLIEPCILAGCPKGGIVLDPFCGSGTTGIVSVRHERDFIGIELNPEYVEMSERRIRKEQEQGIQLSIEMGAI